MTRILFREEAKFFIFTTLSLLVLVRHILLASQTLVWFKGVKQPEVKLATHHHMMQLSLSSLFPQLCAGFYKNCIFQNAFVF